MAQKRERLLGISIILTGVFCGLVWTWVTPLGVQGEWVWEYKEREDVIRLIFPSLMTAIILYVAYLLWKYRASMGRFRSPVTIIILLTLSLLMRVSIARIIPNAPTRMTEVILSDVATSYYSQALKVEDAPSFLSEYAERMDTMPYHAQTHPPGATLIMRWIYNSVKRWEPNADESLLAKAVLPVPISVLTQFLNSSYKRNFTPHQVLGALWAGFLLAFCGALTVIPLYFLTRALYDKDAALISALLFITVPSGLLFLASLDQVLAFLTACSLWLLVAGLKSNRSFPLLLSGLLLGGATWLSFGLLILLPLCLILLLSPLWLADKPNKKPLQSLPRIVLFCLAFAAPSIFLSWGYGCDILPIYKKALAAHHSVVTVEWPRTYWKWILVNLADFVIMLGIPLTLIFGTQLFKRWSWGQARNLPGSLILIFIAILLALDLSGAVRGEVGRIWMFLMIPPIAASGGALSPKAAVQPALLILILLLQCFQAATLQANAVFLRPY